MCLPAGFRIITSIATLYKWQIFKLDVRSAFVQTGSAEREFYVIPLRESDDLGKVLRMLLIDAFWCR